MINLKIDPEFQNQIPPLTDDEYKQLEENILKEGKLISPLIVWNNTLVDGHNRYAILQKHPEICFSTMPLRFENREEAIAWICRNQLGRRNLSPEQKRYLLGKQYEAEKKAAKIFRGNQYTLAKKSGGDHGDNHHSGKKTCDRIAEENGVSRASVLRASHYTRGIDIADNLSPGIKQKVFSGEVKFTSRLTAIMGVFWAMAYIIETIVFFLFGVLFDKTGSYSSSILIAVILSLSFTVGGIFLPETGKSSK